MELLDLLDSKGINNSDVKKAIQYLLNDTTEECNWYKTKQRFTLEPTEIDYSSQREHAIDWFFSKALWAKKKNKSIVVKEIIDRIQCTPLLVYLTIATGVIDGSVAKTKVDSFTDKIDESKFDSRNIRFEEKRIWIKEVGEEKGIEPPEEYPLAEKIAENLTRTVNNDVLISIY